MKWPKSKEFCIFLGGSSMLELKHTIVLMKVRMSISAHWEVCTVLLREAMQWSFKATLRALLLQKKLRYPRLLSYKLTCSSWNIIMYLFKYWSPVIIPPFQPSFAVWWERCITTQIIREGRREELGQMGRREGITVREGNVPTPPRMLARPCTRKLLVRYIFPSALS